MLCAEAHPDHRPPALVYAAPNAFVAVAAPYLREAIDAGEEALAVTCEDNAARLREALGADAGRVDLRPAGTWLTTPWSALVARRRWALVDDLRAIRSFVAARAAAAGIAADRADDLVLAAHEVAANAHLHGGGSATLRTWTADGAFLCEVADDGDGMDDPLAGSSPPATAQIGGRGLWLARQLCDVVQIRTGAGGTVVRLHLTL